MREIVECECREVNELILKEYSNMQTPIVTPR